MSTPAAVVDDPLQAVLDEAQQLMESLGSSNNAALPSSRTASFAIDSDDDEDFLGDVPLNATAPSHPLDASISLEHVSMPMMNHPLAAASVPNIQEESMEFVPNLYQSSFSTGLHQQQQLQQQQQQSQLSYGTLHASYSSTTPVSLDSFKASTSRLASNFASFAQRAAQVTTTAVGTTPAPLSVGSQSINSPSFFSMNQSFSSVSAAAKVSPFAPLPSPPASSIFGDLDQEQKTELVAAHLRHDSSSSSSLLPGERVIMFLADLPQVSDSSGFRYAAQQQPGAEPVIWCCAMTYYRILLFAVKETYRPPSTTTAASSTTEPAPPVTLDNTPAGWNAACWSSLNVAGVSVPPRQIPLSAIEKIEKSASVGGGMSTGPVASLVPGMNYSGLGAASPNGGGAVALLIVGKDNGRWLRFATSSVADTLKALEALQTYAFPGRRNLGYLFAFESKRTAVLDSVVVDASGQKTVTLPPVRKRFDAHAEFARQWTRADAALDANSQPHHQPWTLYSKVNGNYQLCGSYPCVVAGPATIDENTADGQRILRQCALFRSEARWPALTWSASAGSGASLWRCSQPKIGLQGNRSPADELLVKHIMDSAQAANARSASSRLSMSPALIQQLTGSPDLSNWLPEAGCGLKIMDLRPRASAMANRTGGYGYENTSNYLGCTLQFCNITNIHGVRDAYQKLSSLCISPTTSDLSWTSSIEETKWLGHVRLILSAAWEAAYWIHVHRLPVLLHCSHGWDRTSQVAVLAQLLLDPYFRTREGFACVVEKDFMSFGHPFHTRCAHGEGRGEGGTSSTSGSNSTDEGQISPIFIQFLDCVYQVVQLYPECFEFNTRYLLLLSEHVYSCRFGNLLCDTERERELVAGIRQRTHSVWDYLDEREDTRNPGYDPTSKGVLLMPLPTLLRNVTLWTDRHCLHGPKSTNRALSPGADVFASLPFAHDQQGPLLTRMETFARVSRAVESNGESKGNDNGEASSGASPS
jgi:myotubularin-related protein 1/2